MKKTTAVVAAALTATLVAGCGTDGGSGLGGSSAEQLKMNGDEVIKDADASGVEASQRIFDKSKVAVLASDVPEDQLKAARVAVAAGAPMLTAHDRSIQQINEELKRLGADTVYTLGKVNPASVPEGAKTEAKDSAPFDERGVKNDLAKNVENIAALNKDDLGDLGVDHEDAKKKLPPVFTTEATSIPAAATARAAGGELKVLDVPDPRVTKESIQEAKDQDVLALGAQFGDTNSFNDRLSLAGRGELPGGGELVFPGRRMVALYGHPSGPALGDLGAQDPKASVERVKKMVEDYKKFEDGPVVPSFEIIATVASQDAGPDGDYSNEAKVEELQEYVDAITQAGGYAVLDLQPGQANFLKQAKLYEDLLKKPNVGLALDPEWKYQPGQKPLSEVGHVEASEVNEVTDWLAKFTRDNNLPQKALLIHQFQLQMIRDRETVHTDHPELAMVLHADGHGVPAEKYATWDAVRNGVHDGPGDEPNYFMAWKNFLDEDTPMFTPEQTYKDVSPRPWFVSYQ